MASFRTLWDDYEYQNEHHPGCGSRVAPGYAAFFKSEEACFHIKYFTDWNPEETPPTIMKVYGNGNVLFHPYISLRNNFKAVQEENLLIRFVDKTSFGMYRGRKERGVRMYYKEKNVITRGNVLFDNKGDIIQFDPPFKRVIDTELMTQYDALAKEIKKNAQLRAQLTEVPAPQKYVHLYNPEQFYKVVQEANPRNLKTFSLLIHWAKANHGNNRTAAEALSCLFSAQRHKVLQHLGAVKYA